MLTDRMSSPAAPASSDRLVPGVALLVASLCAASAAACGGTETPDPVVKTASPEPSLRHEGEVRLANIVQLTENAGENAEAYWSPDGRELIFQSTRDPYQCDQIFRMPADRPTAPQLVSTGKGRTTCAYFGHDGSRILYASTHEAGEECPPKPDMRQGYVWPIYPSYDIFAADPDGSDLVNLTSSPGYDAEATVCPVDGSILFTSTRDGDLDLYRMDADGKNVKRLTDTLGYDGGAFFSADCKQIVWRASRPEGKAAEDYERLLKQDLVRPGKLEIFVANADGSEARQVTYLGAASFAPYLHPNGKTILFSTNYPNPRGREFDIWAIGVDGSGLERITYAPGFDGFPMFSPDGSKLAFGSNRNQAEPGQTDVYVADWVDDAEARTTPRPADRIARDVAWLADDAREGRGVGTAGIDAASQWLAEQMQKIGLKPGVEGGYRQEFDVPVSVKSGPKTSLTVAGKQASEGGFRPASVSSSGSAAGPAVYVGYGIVDPDLGRDDYAGKRVRGKVAIIQRFVPEGKAFEDEEVSRRLSDPHYKAFLARERGAVAVVFVDEVGAKRKDEADLPPLTLARQGNVGIPVVFARKDAVARALRRRTRLAVTVELQRDEKQTSNVVGVLPGTAPGSGAVIVGAHYDHLGYGDHSSLEPGVRAVHNGADDNASGTVALLEAARILAAGERGERDVYFVAFSAEELGLLGSRHFVQHPPAGLDLEKAVAMVNMDMVGRMRDGKVSVLGGATAREWKAMVGAACDAAKIRCTIGGSGYGPSDQMSFYGEGMPVLQFFTGAHGDYHKSSDDSSRVHAVGIERVAMAVASVVAALRPADVALSFERIPAPLPPGDSRSFGASLGTIPDYAPEEGAEGMKLAGVRPGGPAEKAGLQKGDRLVKLGGRRIGTVRDLVYVLRDAKPGQRVKAVVIREGVKLTVPVTYGKASRRRGR